MKPSRLIRRKKRDFLKMTKDIAEFRNGLGSLSIFCYDSLKNIMPSYIYFVHVYIYVNNWCRLS